MLIILQQKRAEILARNPTAKVTEVVKEIAQSWGVLSKEDKQKYKDAAKKGKSQSFIKQCVIFNFISAIYIHLLISSYKNELLILLFD